MLMWFEASFHLQFIIKNVKAVDQSYKLVQSLLKKIRFAAMKKTLLLLSVIAALSWTCSTDIDVIAPYKEVIVINGLLDPLDSLHYVRVGRGFLGEGNVFTMAQVPDSINYNDILDVRLEKLQGNFVIQTIPMTRTTSVPRDSGLFAYPYQVLYYTPAQILQDGSTYRIVVTNLETSVTAKSTTKIVNDLTVLSPIATDSIDFASAANAPTFVRYVPGFNSKVYDFILRFNYREIDPNGVSTEHSLDWDFNDQFAGASLPGEIHYVFYKYDMFRVFGSQIPVMAGYTRRIDSLSDGKRPFEFIMVEGSEDLLTYLQLQNPSGLVQDRPTFTTVENGLGLFTSRVRHFERRFPNAVTRAAFDTSAYMQNLNFQF
jgi:hypothetical protein